jgi:hypothetical protein
VHAEPTWLLERVSQQEPGVKISLTNSPNQFTKCPVFTPLDASYARGRSNHECLHDRCDAPESLADASASILGRACSRDGALILDQLQVELRKTFPRLVLKLLWIIPKLKASTKTKRLLLTGLKRVGAKIKRGEAVFPPCRRLRCGNSEAVQLAFFAFCILHCGVIGQAHSMRQRVPEQRTNSWRIIDGHRSFFKPKNAVL